MSTGTVSQEEAAAIWAQETQLLGAALVTDLPDPAAMGMAQEEAEALRLPPEVEIQRQITQPAAAEAVEAAAAEPAEALAVRHQTEAPVSQVELQEKVNPGEQQGARGQQGQPTDVRILQTQQDVYFWVLVAEAVAEAVAEVMVMIIMAEAEAQGQPEAQEAGLSIFTQIRFQTAEP